MSYRVALQGFELGVYTLAIAPELQEVNGRKVAVMQGHAQALGVAAMIGGKVDDRFTSWIDVETGRSLRFQTDEYGTRTNDIEHTIIELAQRQGDTVPVTFHINDDTPKPEPQKAALPETWDYNGFLIAMRAWEAPPGTKHPLEVFRSRNLWHIDVTMRGKEKLDTELGELPAVRIDAHTYKLDRDGTKFKNTEERDFSLWISDEAGRVPLQINARTDYGDIKMRIVEYVPGTGEPLRK